jgi:DNA-binding transcriptional LysR family regulator
MSDSFAISFVIGVTPGKWARLWGQRMPQHPLTLVQSTPTEALNDLVNGVVDVCLVRLPVTGAALASIPLYEELAHVVIPQGHAMESRASMTLADLDGENILGGDWIDAIELVAANTGVAVMPQSVARALSRKDVVSRPVIDAPSTTIALVWLSDNNSAEVEEFVGIVRGRSVNSSRGLRERQEAHPADTAAAPAQTIKTKKAKRIVAGPTPKKKYRKRK